jgi:hypothetical protein
MEHPGQYDLKIYKGMTFHRIFVWKEMNVAVDLMGYTARLQVRETRPQTGTPLYEMSTDVGEGIVLGTTPEEQGFIDVAIADDVSTAWTFRRGFYDLELYIDSTVYRLLEGRFIVDAEVTKQ